MKEKNLIYFAKKGPERPEVGPDPLPAGLPISDAGQGEVHESWDPVQTDEGQCGGEEGSCTIPEDGATKPDQTQETALPAGWEHATADTLDGKANKGDLIIIGASYCGACKSLKETLKPPAGKKICYLDLGEEPDEIESKFPDLGNSLPVKYACVDPGTYNKIT